MKKDNKESKALVYRINPLNNLFDSLLDVFDLDGDSFGFSGGYMI